MEFINYDKYARIIFCHLLLITFKFDIKKDLNLIYFSPYYVYIKVGSGIIFQLFLISLYLTLVDISNLKSQIAKTSVNKISSYVKKKLAWNRC